MKSLIALSTVAGLTLTCAGAAKAEDAALSGKTVCVNRYASAPVIDDILKGMNDGLKASGGEKVVQNIQNPEADAATQQTIAQQFANGGCDLIVVIGTAAAQSIQQATKTVPVVFVGVSTPVEAGIVQSLEKPGGNMTGVSDPLPVESEIDGMLSILPTIETIGLIYKVGDPAGDPLAARAVAHIEAKGLKHVTAGIANAGETTQAAQSLVGRVQAIEFPCDTTTISGMAGALKVAKDAKLPVFGCTSDAVKGGAILAGSYSYVTVGQKAADLVVAVLKGADPATTPVIVPKIAGFEINKTEADALGLKIPQPMMSSAVKTY
jgi:putative ABC transport system substrate-binding protein